MTITMYFIQITNRERILFNSIGNGAYLNSIYLSPWYTRHPLTSHFHPIFIMNNILGSHGVITEPGTNRKHQNLINDERRQKFEHPTNAESTTCEVLTDVVFLHHFQSD